MFDNLSIGSLNHSLTHSFNQSISQSTNQSINQSIDQLLIQPVSQSDNRSIDQLSKGKGIQYVYYGSMHPESRKMPKLPPAVKSSS